MNINFDKENGLVPAVIQDYASMQVLMVGYMNEEAYLKTVNEGRVTILQPQQGRDCGPRERPPGTSLP